MNLTFTTSAISTAAMTELSLQSETTSPCKAADPSTAMENVSESVTKTLRSLSFSESMIASIIEEITAPKQAHKAKIGEDSVSKGVIDVSSQMNSSSEDSEVIISPVKSLEESEQVETCLEPDIVDVHVRPTGEPPVTGLEGIDRQSGFNEREFSNNIVYFIEMDEHVAIKEVEIRRMGQRVERLKAKVNKILAKTRRRSRIPTRQVRANLARALSIRSKTAFSSLRKQNIDPKDF